MRHAMILAGGAGTRLWPMSREALPKQLVPFLRGRSLLQIAAERLGGLVPPERRLICTNERYRPAIRAALPEFSDEQIIGEPALRDTLNAVGLASAILGASDPSATIAVFTADHVIRPPEVFARSVALAFDLAEEDSARLVTFSIRPTSPATQYGYVQRGEPIPARPGAFAVRRYVEKPTLEKARDYLRSGDFGWNSGMFVWQARAILGAIRAFQPESHEGLMRIGAAWRTPSRRAVLEAVYPSLPKISVDYAVMEPAASDPRFKVVTVAADVDWLDVGSWPSLADTLEPDAGGNRLSLPPGASATLVETSNSLVASSDPAHHVALLGVDGLVVVHTPDATLVMPRAAADRLKSLHTLLPERLR